MNPWRPLATRGNLILDVLTSARVREAGLTLGGDFFLMVVTPDDGEPAPCFSSSESVGVFITEMQPRAVRFHVAAGEDADAVRALVEGRLQ